MRQLIGSALLLASLSCAREWQLPVTLGSSRGDVHRKLGAPKEVFTYEAANAQAPQAAEKVFGLAPNQSIEYYYASGLVGRYDRDHLFSITVMAHVDYRGWLEYSGAVVNGITLRDTRENVVRRLGTPTKVEEEQFLEGNAATAAVFPASSRYFWRRDGHVVEIEFLRQPQLLDTKRNLVAPRDSITKIAVYR